MTANVSVSHQQYYVVDSPLEVARWRPLVHWLLFVPHALILHALRALAGVIWLVYWLTLIVTGRLHRGLYGMMVLYERYDARATGHLLGFSEEYPPFDFAIGGDDNDAYPPLTLNLPGPPESASRARAWNVVLAIPHYAVLAVLAVAAIAGAVFGWFAVLLTGRWPRGLRAFLVRYANYYYRVWLYVAMVEPEYPAFGVGRH